jgi:hypothetical protein
VNLVTNYLRDLTQAAIAGWNRFWFTPTDVATLALMRILGGAMLFYTHLVWGFELDAFFGSQGYIPVESARVFYGDSFRWALSYLWYVQSPTALWGVHLAALIVLAMFTLGLCTRITSILSFVVAVSYANRVPGALFGLDQINVMLATYLMLAPCGAAYSLDRWLAARRAGGPLPPAPPSTTANVVTRLIQLHMCIIYFFAGLGKLQGEMWWEGTALWGAAFNLEYQTVNLTWLARFPVLTAFLTQATAYWEMFFCVLVWPRLLRPITVFIALPLHLSIGICMGLMTFGLVMPIGVMSFVSPSLVRRLIDRNGVEIGAGEGGTVETAPTSPSRDPRRPVRRAS